MALDRRTNGVNNHMNKLIIGAATAAALLATVGVASAQTWQNDGYSGRGRMIERNVGMPTYGEQDAYGEERMSPNYGWSRTRDGSTFESRSFRSQEVLPQSPPTGS